MKKTPILIVDDEKNIRLTISQALEPLGIPVQTAVNGEEALQKLNDVPFRLIFLDLKMPGIDGMNVLRQIKQKWPKIQVIIITAHGTIESAVDAMKLGAADFIPKPFSPVEIREIAKKVMEREALDKENAFEYFSLIELTKRHISERNFSLAVETVRNAIAADPAHPEAYNLLGALLEIKGELLEAQKFYRAALDIDTTYKPALANLERVTSWKKFGRIDFGPGRKEKETEKKNEGDINGEE